jgi:hypothetical protein
VCVRAISIISVSHIGYYYQVNFFWDANPSMSWSVLANLTIAGFSLHWIHWYSNVHQGLIRCVSVFKPGSVMMGQQIDDFSVATSIILSILIPDPGTCQRVSAWAIFISYPKYRIVLYSYRILPPLLKLLETPRNTGAVDLCILGIQPPPSSVPARWDEIRPRPSHDCCFVTELWGSGRGVG